MKKEVKVIIGNPDKCKGHVWRHLCLTNKSGTPNKKSNCKGIAFGNCNRLICINCGGLEKDRREYQCFKCGHYFSLFRELDTDKPTCNKCFAELLKINNARDYRAFIG